MNSGVPFDDNANCDDCGQFGAFRFDGATLCAGCYQLHGTCNPEPGRDAGEPGGTRACHPRRQPDRA